MTITVTAPNGAKVDFPDGTDHDTINSVMTQNFHPDATSNAPAPDKYQQAAASDIAAVKAAGGDEGAGFTRRLAHGATLGADSTILAGLQTPLEMIKHGTFNPAEGYDYAKAREDQIMGDARQNTGALGTAAEVLGGGVAGSGLANAGVTAARFLAPDAGLLARSGASALDAAGLGGFSGAMEGNGLQERATNAVKGGLTGGLVGGALPGALSLAHAVTAPIISNLRALTNPEGFAQSQIARAVSESGQTPQALGQQVADANATGQPFTLADALGNPGQRMLSTVARAPGEGRTAAVNFLEGRQAGQGRRVAGALAEGFNAPETAAQTEARLTAARGADADAAYGAVRNDAEPVDVSNVVDHINQQVAPFGVPHDRISPDGITGRLLAYRRMLSEGDTNLDGSAAGGLNDFSAAQMVRHDLSDEVQAATRSGQNNKARVLGGVLRQLDSSLENSSAGFRQANSNFAQASRNIDAVQAGRNASMRGRTEDTIPAFQALPVAGQQAFRSGYVDPLIAQTQGAAFGINKARPLINDAFQTEAGVMAPGNPLMQQRLAREQTMFETRNAALGGSRTADNLNDHAALGVDPHLVGQVLSGNWHGAVRSALQAGHTAMTGNTAAVREAVGRMLLDQGVNPASLQQAIGNTVQRIQFVQNIARNMGRGAAGGLAVTGPGQQRQ